MSQESGVRGSRRVLGAVATLFIMAGAGHFSLGRYRRGLIWLGICALALPLVLLAVLLEQPAMLWIAVGGTLLGRIAAAVDTLRAAPGKFSALPSQECTSKVAVPPNQVFVVGDNRDNSHDSRHWGPVPHDLIKGTAWFVFWSRGSAGFRPGRINLRLR